MFDDIGLYSRSEQRLFSSADGEESASEALERILFGDAHYGLAAHDVLHDLGFSRAQAELLADAGRLLGDAVLINRLAIGVFASWSGGSLSLCGTVLCVWKRTRAACLRKARFAIFAN